ncbi:DUF11 domain-containing protein [Myceligenerans pegani]|uniref:DUF11 domain-containing protein n=1 Tax=Myceligenerans pegani TaxID=2776917 RepID=A0ABR9N1A0_9MICO|nr:DUF11 domain-containing protein [Myceligenerans sp. TRM 65318]MBE1877425.1 DUF11 domain-containing protein [Myceligenerans sp. TRM 65318]MBE3019696.1 DUF11 domain-containing protein [Myceligenerans sp. TRM 65318]
MTRRTSPSGAARGRHRAPRGRHRAESARPSLSRRLIGGVLAAVTATSGLVAAAAPPATAATVYEITGEWEADTPATVGRGDVVNAVWRVNVNDDPEAPANDPVENVTFTATVDRGEFTEIPDLCLTDDVDPPSAISADGKTLTCNLGTVVQGTAVVVQTPVVVDGETGEELTAVGEIDGLEAPLDPIAIVNDFAMDMQFGGNTEYIRWNGNYTAVDLDLQWALRLRKGSDPGPDSVTYRLRLTDSNGAAVTVGTGIYGDVGCSPFNANRASGVPWSELPNYPADQQTDFVDSCTLTPVAGQPGVFDLTLSGIDYDVTDAPTKDSTIAGDPLPTDWNYIASGSLWLRIATNQSGSVTLQSNAPTYTSTTGLTSTDLPGNNSTNKTYTLPGRWAAPWYRAYTGAGGTNWDDTYRVSAGTTVMQYVNNYPTRLNAPPTAQHGQCLVFDTDYVTYTPPPADSIIPMIRGFAPVDGGGGAAELDNPPTIQYYVGNVADPNTFNCGADAANWTTTEPADLSTVQAVRIVYPGSLPTGEGYNGIQLAAYTTIKDDVPVGQDVWMFGSVYNPVSGIWEGPGEPWDSNDWVSTPGARYPFTNGRRDILRIIYATPAIRKSADQSVVRPGAPATFTLTYSANGSGAIPDTVDDYTITDTLPVGMTYVAGSADPEPAVTTDAQGRQVLTWTLDDVPTNAEQDLTYQAVAANSVRPGDVLTNTATSELAGETSRQATAQVTVSSSGSTLIAKTTDQWFIANPDGSGDGTGSWTVTLKSEDPQPQAFTDTIDILPYNGDGRGTDYAGTYRVTGVDAPAGATVYYTDADPATLSDDPADSTNGAAGNPAGNTVGWTTTMPAEPTAIRVIGGELAPGATSAFTVHMETDGADPGDVWVNRAQARAEHTRLVMRTSEPLTMGTMYSASLKKYVQDAEGTWRDANDVADHPVFRDGDTIRYRIVVENTGQGTLTNVVVSDDQQPELGSFTIDELAPGATESHEFEIEADASAGDSLVNTACAEADQPDDAEDPPTINCDPAGFEVDGEPTHEKTLVSATPIGDGRWEVVYGIEVSNVSAASTSYSLDDELHFTEEATIESAEVTSSPDGVTLADPAWDGQGNLTIASGVPLAGNDDDGYAPHTYELTVIAEVPLQVPGAGGADDPTACGADGDDSDTAFNNTSALTDERGAVEEDQACAPIPSIDITKSVSEGPVPGGDGTWTVTYDIVAKNSGRADGEYDVTDRMTADGDLVIESGEVVATPDGVTASPDWTGLGADENAPENVVATGVNLPAGESHTYQVEVVLSVDDEDGSPVITPCSAEPGENGGLSNTARIEHNELTDDAEACVTVAYITVDKTVSEGPTPNGDGTWTVVYDVVAENTGEAGGAYDVYDRLRLGNGVDVVAKDVTGPDGVTLEAGWTGLGDAPDAAENLIATGASLDAGATHTYRVELVVSLDEETIDPGTLVCPPPGSGESGGLANGTLLDHNGIVGEDEVCPTLPLIDVDKTIGDGPTPNGDGTWTITYDLVATNTGAAEGDYDLSDRLRYGDGIEVESAAVTTAPDGVTPSAGWTGRGADGADENVVATDVALPAGDSHTYQVRVVVSLDEAVVTPGTLECPEPGSGGTGGLANVGELTHNGETRDDDACAPLPLIDVAKSLAGAVTPVAGRDGVYDATYEVTVTNRGPGAGTYDLDDTLAPGKGVTVVGVEEVTTDAPDPVGINPGFDGTGDPRIVTDQPIAEATDAPVVHTYRVTVRYAADLGDVELSGTAGCTTDRGTVAGALANVADVTWNGITGSDDECVRPGKPTLDKALVSAKPAEGGTWKVVYDLTVGNVGTEPTTYDLDDELLFAPVVTPRDVEVTGPEGVTPNPGFDGEGDQRIATGVRIGGLDDEGYAPHVYRVTVIAQVPSRFGEVGADGTGSPACTAPPGSNLVEQGLNNAATLTDETGGKQTDTDCAPLPPPDAPAEPGDQPGDPGTPSDPPPLASTGTDIGWIVAAAALLILLGAAALIIAHRRRRTG